MKEAERVDAFLNIIGRMEPDLGLSSWDATINRDAALASIAISQRRAADALCRIADALCRWGDGDDADSRTEQEK